MKDKTDAPFITEAECTELAQLMQRKYAGFLAERYFEVSVSTDPIGVHAKVTLRNKTGAYFYPVEGRIAHVDTDLSPRASGLFLLEYTDAYFDEYFREGGDVYLPIDWAEYESEGVPLQLKGQIFNLVIEKMADELLAGTGGVAKLDDASGEDFETLH